MEEVSIIISGQTNLWASDHTSEQIKQELAVDEQDNFAIKMLQFSVAGYHGLSTSIVRHEGTKGGGETWRVAYKNGSLFRVVGFFEEANKRDFIALDAFYKKSGDDYSKAQWKRMKEISEIKQEGDTAWKRKEQ